MTALRKLLRAPRWLHRYTGSSASGMVFSKIGNGPKTMLVLPGGPGSEIPSSSLAWITEGGSKHYVAAGYSVWTATRPRNMPSDFSTAGMADEYARFIREEIGEPVDAVLGQSFGGMLSIHLAANHPDTLRHLVLAGSAATISKWGATVDRRSAALQAEGRYADAAGVLLDSLVDIPRFLGFRTIAARAVGIILSRAETPAGDLVVEAKAEADCDARDALADIECPVLLLAGTCDRFFTLATVEETASRLRDAAVITYVGRGHAGLFTDGRLPRDIRSWLAAKTG